MAEMSGLAGLPLLRDEETRSISAENPTGEKGAGATAQNHLGVGWKGRPCITLPAEGAVDLAAVAGPGVIRHMWFTISDEGPRGGTVLRDVVLRCYWDGEEAPSVETPIGDFFANGHAMRCDVNSLPIVVNPAGGMNSYWPMPFSRSARITAANEHGEELPHFFYQITYSLGQIPEGAARFHAQWRRENPVTYHQEYTILDGVRGRGHYVGTYLAWTQLSSGWWGEGEIKFYIDGDQQHPTICGTGTEDYVGGAWCFGGRTYSTPFLGYPLRHAEAGQIIRHGLYRWHVPDPVRFRSDLRVTIQDLGFTPQSATGYEPLTDDISSVAYWYQRESHAPFLALPPAAARWPR
ncbi:MAG: glycoside hydrolase family 172 protein [Planctomycetota bacterium]